MNKLLQNSVRILIRSRLVFALSMIPVITSLGLMTLPLFRDFDYEYNAVMGVCIFLVSAAVTASVFRKNIGNKPYSDEQIDIEIRNSNLYIFTLSLIVVFASLVASFTMVALCAIPAWNCISLRGFQLFLLLPVTSAVVGCGLGYLVAAVFSRFAWVALVIILAISLVLNLLWIKLQVPIYVYSIFWGYFPGPIYDEWIPVTATLWIHRLWSLIFALLFVVIAQMWRSRPHIDRKYLYYFTAAFVVILAIYGMRFRIGFDAGYDEVKKELGGEIRSEDIDLIFDVTLDNKEIKRMMGLANFYHEQICVLLDINNKRQVTIYIYKDERQKKQLMGAGRTNFAKIFNDEIHVNYEDAESILKHEITHVLANDFGNPYYGTGRIGFLEGTAVATEWNENYFTPHEWAAALKKQNKLPDIVSLVGPRGFFANAAGMSYTVSGSFTRYLIDTYGPALLKRAYYEEDIQNVYGLPADTLSERWKIFLDGIPVTAEDVKLAAILIQPAIFQKRCPHYVADILEDANTEYGNGNYTGAERALQKALTVDKGNYRILMHLIRSRYYAGALTPALRDVDSLLTLDHINYTSRAALGLLRGDLFLRLRDLDSAQAQYRSVSDTFVNISSVYIAAKMRIELLHKGSIEPLQHILSTQEMDEQMKWMEKLTREYPENNFYKFWLSRMQFQQSEFLAVTSLWANRVETIPDSIMEFERLKMLAESYLRLDEYDSSREYWVAARDRAHRTMEREYIDQRLALLDWLKRRSN